MIINEAELRVMLGLQSSITDNERALITLVLPAACGQVKEFIGYDPVQAEHTDVLPRGDIAGGVHVPTDGGMWRVNVGRSRAMWEETAKARNTLQVTTLPIREVSAVYVDTQAKHGQASGAFAASTAWTAGSDYWVDWEELYSGSTTRGVARTGCLYSYGSWPTETGTVKVVYRGGYSPTELLGRATSNSVESSVITMNGVDASPIKRATLLQAVKMFHTESSYQKRATGFIPGALKSENAGDYSYTKDGDATAFTGMTTGLSDEAKALLEPFVHWGRLRL